MGHPDFSFEKKLWEKEIRFVGGADEVGRGSFAGPVVAACVVFDKSVGSTLKKDLQGKRILINDSKKLSCRQRVMADEWIRKNALAVGVGSGSVAQINRLGITKASAVAFRSAVKNAGKFMGGSIGHLLVDAFFVPYLRGLNVGKKKYVQKKDAKIKLGANQSAIIKGDQKSISIAAASIVAKVYRDKLMSVLSQKHELAKYGWGTNKGYGTKYHRQAIQKYGLSRLHRKKFVEKITYFSFSRGQ